MTNTESAAQRATALRHALAQPDASSRLQAALSAGTTPDPEYVEELIARCAIEPDFYVRDMLTWALTRQDPALTLPRLLPELHSPAPQARSQALHTLSKIADPSIWPEIPPGLLVDEDDEVARTAWRTSAGLVPEGAETALAETLSTQFGRGDRDVQLSLSRAFAVIGEPAASSVARATDHNEEHVRIHAIATERIMSDPEEGFDAAIAEARRVFALRSAPQTGDR
ncbi:HEAT repeat domain-containing protein [Microbacterium sp. KUDC0406]|uniref:HEAT repeat domain-containing protein n=1 Tax=Microbacterium sp. KUDC0406 TaxID=2909588 RepID=UPI001F3FE09E|nr:HEAT repeat domain-containing protein [Microbacterium sp. KUDC0406]UJP11278.1 HEAT repeat domain-containing protein [Microbacterium sp. KUDC0406]